MPELFFFKCVDIDGIINLWNIKGNFNLFFKKKIVWKATVFQLISIFLVLWSNNWINVHIATLKVLSFTKLSFQWTVNKKPESSSTLRSSLYVFLGQLVKCFLSALGWNIQYTLKRNLKKYLHPFEILWGCDLCYRPAIL